MWSRILKELAHHLPFTAAGAVSGIVILVLLVRLWPAAMGEPHSHDHERQEQQQSHDPIDDHDHEHDHDERMIGRAHDHDLSHGLFHALHFMHVFFSALVTAAMYRRYKANVLLTIAVGYVGSVALCSMSDIIFPFLGGALLGMDMHFHFCGATHWYIVHPLAFVGIFIAFIRPITRFPHFSHVLISTWASLFYLIGYGEADWLRWLPAIFVILLLAVWIPCCLSDIVFPLLFVGKNGSLRSEPREH